VNFLNIFKKKISFLIVPESPEGKTSTHRFTLKKIFLLVLSYSLIAGLAGFYFFSFTAGSFLLPADGLSQSDISAVKELNSKLIFLTRELEGLKSTNERLRYAISLGDTTSADSLKSVIDSSKKKVKAEGSLFSIIKTFFFKQEKNETKLRYFLEPAVGFISREFDPSKGHIGIDYVLKSGTPVYAAGNGYIVFSNFTVNDGYMLIINHPGNYVTIYKHLSSLLKKERETVIEGDLIGFSGNTGETTTGPHLHFEIWREGKPVNPKNYLLKLKE
jgi:murein DD-endopeptidase MepM/ murein hydrolase activator NlpD